MPRSDRFTQRRDKLIAQLAQHADAVSGNLSKAAVPPGSTNFYWRITWKERQKTRIQYVRAEDVDAIQRGTRHFTSMKKLLQAIGDLNRTMILSRSKRPS